MPAYSPPPQILASPIRSYYQGKALRADTALREKQAEALQMEIDSAPAAAAAAGRKEQREVSKEDRLQAKADREAQEYVDQGHAQEVIDIGKGFAAYTAAVEKDPSLRKEAYALLNEHLTEIAGPEKSQEFIKKFDRNNNGFYEPNEEALIKAAGFAAEKVSYSQATYIDEDGRAVQGAFNSATGEYTGSPNTPIAPQAGQGDISGLSDSGLNQTTIKFREQVKQSTTTARMATELVEISHRDPAALGKSGAIVSFGNDMYKTAKNLVEMVGAPNLPASETEKQSAGYAAFDWSETDKSIEKLGLTPIDAARFKSGIYGIAFSAAVGEQGSRPSDKDIQAYIKIYGGDITDAKVFRGTIAQAMRRQDSNLRLTAELNPEITDSDAAIAIWDRSYNAFKSSLGSGAGSVSPGRNEGRTATGPNGERVIMKNGELVPYE